MSRFERHAGVTFLCVLGLFSAAANAEPSRNILFGKWQFNAGKSEVHSGKTSGMNLTLEQNGASVHVVRTSNTADGKQTVMDFTCTTDAKDCDANEMKVSLWYDGTTLMELDMAKGMITKYNMTPAPDGKSMRITVTNVWEKADVDKLVLDKTAGQ